MEEKKSRANYFKERRKNTSTFYVEIDKSLMEKLEKYLSAHNVSKKEWLSNVIKKINE